MELHVSELAHSDINAFCSLIREVYDEFIAPEYSDEGNQSFYCFIDEKAMHERMDVGALMISAKVENEVVGACSFRDISHLSTFFVKRDFQRRGVGRMMFAYALGKLKTINPKLKVITVNSSPFAFPVYKRLGFVPTAERQQNEGLVYYPMEYKLGR